MAALENEPALSRAQIFNALRGGRQVPRTRVPEAARDTQFSPCSGPRAAQKRPISEAVAGNLSQKVEKGAGGYMLPLHPCHFLTGFLRLAIPSTDSSIFCAFLGCFSVLFSPPCPCLPTPRRVAHTEPLNNPAAAE